MAEFHEAGGVPRLLAEIADVLDHSARTVAGATVGEIIARVPARHEDRIIRRRSDPVVPVGAIAVLTGNLAAPQGRSSSTPPLRRNSSSTRAGR